MGKHRVIAAAAAFVVASSPMGMALAQQPASETQAASDAPAAVVITEKAREHFRAGVAFLQDPDGARYEEAYQQFKAAYEESPSWKILGNLGVAAMKLERDGEAIAAFEKYLGEGGSEVTGEEREQFESDLAALRASIITVQIEAEPQTTILDVRHPNRGNDVKNQYVVDASGTLVLQLRPGEHELSASLAERGAPTWKLSGAPGSNYEHRFELVEPSASTDAAASASETKSRPMWPAYTALGVGVVGVGVGVAFLVVRGGQNKKGQSLYDSCLDSQTCGTSDINTIKDHDKQAATAGTIAIVGFGVGAVGLGTGLALLFAGSNKKDLSVDTGSIQLTPYAGWGHIGMTGKF